MEKSDLIALLNDKYNSSLYDLILDRLEFFSYQVQEKDIPMIAQCLQLVEDTVKLQCNIDEIPSSVDFYIVDAVLGEFFGVKKAFNQLDITSLDLGTAIASVSMGNTSVSYNAGDSDSAKLDAYITASKNTIKEVYACLRKIRW